MRPRSVLHSFTIHESSRRLSPDSSFHSVVFHSLCLARLRRLFSCRCQLCCGSHSSCAHVWQCRSSMQHAEVRPRVRLRCKTGEFGGHMRTAQERSPQLETSAIRTLQAEDSCSESRREGNAQLSKIAGRSSFRRSRVGAAPAEEAEPAASTSMLRTLRLA